MLSGDIAACISRTAAASRDLAGLISTVRPSVSSAYVPVAAVGARGGVPAAPGSSSGVSMAAATSRAAPPGANAGIMIDRTVAKITDDDWQKVIAVN
jgi:hypothetical protein